MNIIPAFSWNQSAIHTLFYYCKNLGNVMEVIHNFLQIVLFSSMEKIIFCKILSTTNNTEIINNCGQCLPTLFMFLVY